MHAARRLPLRGAPATLIGMLGPLGDWLVTWADSPVGLAVLIVLTAAEAVFFPLPPDPLLIALGLLHPQRAILLGVVTTASSVAGGLAGHWLGLRFGRPLLLRLASGYATRVELLVRRHSFWAIVIAGLTPIPYKVFTVAAGVFAVPRTRFVLASIVGRGGRFITIGVLISFWGERLRDFFETRFELVTAVAGVALIAALALWALRIRAARARPGSDTAA